MARRRAGPARPNVASGSLALALGLLALASADAAADAPGRRFTLVPKPRPGAAVELGIEAWVRPEPAAMAAGRWSAAEPPLPEPAPKPGTWSTSLDPSIDLGPPQDLDRDAPGADLAGVLDPIFVESVTLRLTRHF